MGGLQDIHAIDGQNNVTDFQTGSLSWRIRFNGRHDDRSTPVYPESEFPRLPPHYNFLVAF